MVQIRIASGTVIRWLGPHTRPSKSFRVTMLWIAISAASLWEIAIKSGLGRADFVVNPRLLRRGLLENGYSELPVTGAHAVAVDLLPGIHRDPFDRLLIAQAQVEGVTLWTMDELVGRYPGPIQLINW